MTDAAQDTSEMSHEAVCVPDEDKRTPEQQEVIDILYAMKQDPEFQSMCLLGKDGVLRSWDADSNVVDAVPLRPALIKAFFEASTAEQSPKKNGSTHPSTSSLSRRLKNIEKEIRRS